VADRRLFGTWKAPGTIADLDGPAARDLLIECFYTSQRRMFERQKRRMGIPVHPDSIRRSVNGAVRAAFRREGACWEDPGRQEMERVIERLSVQARAWGTPEAVIQRNRSEFEKVLARLQL
jgi:hypothetical protein